MIIFYRQPSWSNTFGVTREQRTVSDVLQGAVQHHNSFKTDSSSTVRISSVSEAFNIVLDGRRVNSFGYSSFFKHNGVMNPLSS